MPENGESTPESGRPRVKLNPAQAVVYFQYDLAVYMIAGQANLLRAFKQEDHANQFEEIMKALMHLQGEFTRACADGQNLVVPVQGVLRAGN